MFEDHSLKTLCLLTLEGEKLLDVYQRKTPYIELLIHPVCHSKFNSQYLTQRDTHS